MVYNKIMWLTWETWWRGTYRAASRWWPVEAVQSAELLHVQTQEHQQLPARSGHSGTLSTARTRKHCTRQTSGLLRLVKDDNDNPNW